MQLLIIIRISKKTICLKFKTIATDKYINENKTATFNKGDRVVMHSCAEDSFYKDTIWTCETDSFLDKGKEEVVFLEFFSGCFSTQFLKREKKQTITKTNN